MSVTDQDTFNSSEGNGVTTVFPYSFKLVKPSDLKITINGVLVATGFSLSGIGNANGGNITFETPPGADLKVLRYRDIPLERTGDFQENGDWKAGEVNFELDRIWQALQGLKALVDLKPGLPLDDYPGVDFSIPPPVAGGYWRWKLDGSAIEYVTFLEQNTPVSPYGGQLILSADAAAARALLDFDARVGELIATALSDYQQNIHYPVGSEYKNYVDDTSPATILGFGTWARVGGVVTVGRAPADAEFGTLGATGGAKTHTLTAAEIPPHQHAIAASDNETNAGYGTFGNGDAGSFYTRIDGGGGGAHNNLQPYVVVSLWKRTA